MLSISSGRLQPRLLEVIRRDRPGELLHRRGRGGRAAGPLVGRRRRALGLRGLVDPQDMRAVYERFLDPRDRRFNDPSGGTRCPPSATPAASTCPRTSCTPPRLNASRTPPLNAGLNCGPRRASRPGTTSRSSTSRSTCRSRSRCCTPRSRPRRCRPPPGDEETAEAWAAFRQAVEDAIWAGNNAGARLPGRDTPATPGSGTTAAPAAARSTPTTGSWRRSSSTTPATTTRSCTSTTRRSTASRARTGCGARSTGAACYGGGRAAAAVAERTTEERLTHALGVLVATRPDGKAREIVGVAQEAMDLFHSRGRAAHREGRGAGRGVRGPLRPRPERARARPAAAAGHAADAAGEVPRGETREELLDRVDAQLRADIDGGLAGVAGRAAAARGRRATAAEWSPRAVIELALADGAAAQAGWTRADLTAGDQRRAARLPRRFPTAQTSPGCSTRLTARPLECAAGSHRRPRPATTSCPPSCGWPTATPPTSAWLALYATRGARAHRTDARRRHAASSAPRRCRTRCGTAVPRRLRESGIELGVDQAAAVRGVLTSGARVESLVGPAGTGKSFVVGAIARGWNDPTLGRRRAAGVRAGDLADRHRRPRRRGLRASNVTRWLATQDRLAGGPGRG